MKEPIFKTSASFNGDEQAQVDAVNERLHGSAVTRRAKMPVPLRDFPKRPDQHLYVPVTREQCKFSKADVDAYLSGLKPRLGNADQGALRTIRRLEMALAEAEEMSIDPDDRMRSKARDRRVAYLKAELEFERDEIRVYLLSGANWGSFDRECSLIERWNQLAQNTDPEAKPGTPRMVEPGEFDAMQRDHDLESFRRYARGVLENDIALRAYGLGRSRSRRELAVRQARAGLPIDV